MEPLATMTSHLSYIVYVSTLDYIGSSIVFKDLITPVKSQFKYNDLVYCFINYFFPTQWVIIYYN